MKNPTITVVVPVYNMGKYLPKAIDCLLAQTYVDYEILIVDDGSTDGSSEICNTQGQKDKRIKVIHKENGGLSSARNCGIENATGQFIIFPDPDDWVEPYYLENLIALQNRYNSDIEICAHYVTDEKGDKAHIIGQSDCLFSNAEAMDILMGRSGFCGFAWNKLYHLDTIINNNLRFDEELGMAQDLHFAFRYFCFCERIAYSTKPSYHYYQESGGITTQNKLTERKVSGLLTYKKIAELAHEKYPKVEEAAYGTIYNMSLHFIFLYFDTCCDEGKLYYQLRMNLKKYHEYYFRSNAFGFGRKILGMLAEINPKVSYTLRKMMIRQ